MIDLKNPRLRRILVVAVVVTAGAAAWLLWPRHDRAAAGFTGYVVSDDIYMTSPVAGTVGATGWLRAVRKP